MSLASQTLNASRNHSRTPVLVIPRQVTLLPDFFVDFAGPLLASGVVRVRFDWVVDASLLRNSPAAHLQFWRTRRHVAKIHRGLKDSHGSSASMELASVLSRPTDVEQGLIVGVCHSDVALPIWSWAITARLLLKATC
ncbi:MAG: hypothetical protein WBD20_04505 [Pirellulaceae bacterium]